MCHIFLFSPYTLEWNEETVACEWYAIAVAVAVASLLVSQQFSIFHFHRMNEFSVEYYDYYYALPSTSTATS